MSKPFYSIEEACDKLSATEEEIKQHVRDGSLREFRDAGRVFFKSDDVDKLISTDSDSGYEFAYEAINAAGIEVKSTICAPSKEDAVSKIRGKGEFPTRVIEPKLSKPPQPHVRPVMTIDFQGSEKQTVEAALYSNTVSSNVLAVACIATFIVGFIAGALIMQLGAS